MRRGTPVEDEDDERGDAPNAVEIVGRAPLLHCGLLLGGEVALGEAGEEEEEHTMQEETESLEKGLLSRR